MNDVLRIVIGCLHPTSMDHLPIVSGIQPAELRRLGVAPSLAKCCTLDPYHILHGQLVGSFPDVSQERLKSRRPFVPSTPKLLNNISKLVIRAAQWTNYKWSAEYSKRISVLHVFIPRASSRPLGIDLPRTSWVKLNCMRTGVGRFHLSLYKWNLASSPICKCGATDQTADHVISAYPFIGHMKW